MSSGEILVLMFGALTLFMLTGLPIAFVLGGLSLLFTVTLWNPGAVVVLEQATFSQLVIRMGNKTRDNFMIDSL